MAQAEHLLFNNTRANNMKCVEWLHMFIGKKLPNSLIVLIGNCNKNISCISIHDREMLSGDKLEVIPQVKSKLHSNECKHARLKGSSSGDPAVPLSIT